MKIWCGHVLVGEVITNRSISVEDALKLIDFDEEKFLSEQGWDALDYNDFCLDYTSQVTMYACKASEHAPYVFMSTEEYPACPKCLVADEVTEHIQGVSISIDLLAGEER